MTSPRKERKPRRPAFPFAGKFAVIEYPTSTARVAFLKDRRMKWVVTDSEGRVSTATESVTYLQLDDNTHMLTWTETNGFSVTQVIDTACQIVKAFWSRARQCGCCRDFSGEIHGSFKFDDDGWEGGSLPKKARTKCTPSKS